MKTSTAPDSTAPASAPASALDGARFDHIGVVVRTLDKGRLCLSQTLGIVHWTVPLVDTVNGVHLMFGRDPCGVVYELLAPLDPSSPVQAALQARKNLLNHTAYLVPDLAQAAQRMRAAGCAPTAEPKAAIAYGNRPIQFFVTPLNTIIELIEAPEHRHLFVSPVAPP
jgi:methylmalonyl-CoA/ethylmalonyl-CoA epimerase